MHDKLKLKNYEKQIILASKGWFKELYDIESIEAVSIIVTEITNCYDPTLSGVYYYITEIIKKMKFNFAELNKKLHKDIEMTYNWIDFNKNNQKYDTTAYLKTLVSFISSSHNKRFPELVGEPDYKYFEKAYQTYSRLKSNKNIEGI